MFDKNSVFKLTVFQKIDILTEPLIIVSVTIYE